MLILDKDGSQYVIPLWLTLKGFPISVNNTMGDRAFGHGSVFLGDGQIGAREITLSGTTGYAASAEDHEAELRELVTALYRGEQKLIVDNKFYINVRLAEIEPEYAELFGRRLSDIDVVLIAADPFKYSMNETTETVSCTENPQQFTIVNPGMEAFPVITATAGVTNSSFTLTNITDGNRMMGYQDVQLTATKAAVFDSVKGTVTRDTSNTLNFFGGTFLRLLPGANLFEYAGAACDIQFTYRKRWV